MVLSGCSVARQAPLPNGERGYTINHCPELRHCLERAASLCGGAPYELLSQSESLRNGVTVLVKCKKP